MERITLHEIARAMSEETDHLRARAAVARKLAGQVYDTGVASLLLQVSEELEEEAVLREVEQPDAGPSRIT